jgi:hypothetical protein
MWAKNQYALLFGPSDERGVISITGDELVSAARAEAGMFPMDFVAFPAEWSGGIGAKILDAAGVQRLREGIRVWGDDHVPHRLAADLDAYEKRVQPLAGRKLKAEVAYSG